MKALYELRVSVRDGERLHVYGNNDTMRQKYDEVREMLDAPEGTVQPRTVEILGMTNTADRAEIASTVLFEDIRSVTFMEVTYSS